MNSSQEIAATIKKIAKQKQISIGEMLSECGLGVNTLSTMQSGGYYPRLEAITKIAECLDCSVDYLLGRSETPAYTQEEDEASMKYTQEISFRIKETAKEKGLTTKQLLDDCGLHINTLSDLANGKHISYLSLAKIADRLNVSIDYLLGRTENQQVNEGNSITTGNIKGNNNANMNFSQGSVYDSRDYQEIADMLKGLSLLQRSEIVVMINKMRSEN